MTFGAPGQVNVLIMQPFHNFETNFSEKVVHLPKHMVVAYEKEPPMTVMTASSPYY